MGLAGRLATGREPLSITGDRSSRSPVAFHIFRPSLPGAAAESLAVADLFNATGHGTVDPGLHLIEGHPLAPGDVADDKVLGLVEHPPLTIREVFLQSQVAETLEHPGHLGDRPRPHLVGVFLETTLPIVVEGYLRVLENDVDLFYLFSRDHASQ